MCLKTESDEVNRDGGKNWVLSEYGGQLMMMVNQETRSETVVRVVDVSFPLSHVRTNETRRVPTTQVRVDSCADRIDDGRRRRHLELAARTHEAKEIRLSYLSKI